MYGPRDCHIEWSKSDIETKLSQDTAYMWNFFKKGYKWTRLQNRNRVTDVENKLMFTGSEGAVLSCSVVSNSLWPCGL